MELKILTDNLTESDVDWHVFWARTMLARNIEDVVPELTALAELNQDNAIMVWYNLFNVGENLQIDENVKDYPDMTDLEALQQIDEAVWDLQNRTKEMPVKECLEKIEECSLALVKCSQKIQPKISTMKGLKECMVLHFDFITIVEDEQNKLDEIISSGSVQLVDLVDCLGKLIKAKSKLKPEHKKVLKQISKIPYSIEIEEKLTENAKIL